MKEVNRTEQQPDNPELKQKSPESLRKNKAQLKKYGAELDNAKPEPESSDGADKAPDKVAERDNGTHTEETALSEEERRGIELDGAKPEEISLGKDELAVCDSRYLDSEGNVDWGKWAPNGGRVEGTIKENQTLEPGTIIDRYGSHWGKYTSPENTPFEERSLPYKENPNAYHKYEVLKPIGNVTSSEIAPAFDQKGGGTQYELPRNVRSLVKDDYLKEVT